MAKDPVITAPLAIISVGGYRVGKMKNIEVDESIRRGRVSGLGQLTPDELPPLEWSGTLRCSFYNINFHTSQIPGAILRTTATFEDWLNTILLEDVGVQIDIYRKASLGKNATTGAIDAELKLYATITGLFLDKESFNIAEGQISGRDQSFSYINPITYAPQG